MASLGACENLTTVGTAGTWTPITSPTTVTIQCQLDKSTGLYNLDPVLTTSAHLVFVFCVIVFCIFALTTLLLWIPLYRIEHERFEWYCLTPRPGSKRRCGHFWALSPLWIVLTILLIVPLAVYYIVFLVIVVLIDVSVSLHAGVGLYKFRVTCR